eukprot:2740449-Amphidinium_carterae.1
MSQPVRKAMSKNDFWYGSCNTLTLRMICRPCCMALQSARSSRILRTRAGRRAIILLNCKALRALAYRLAPLPASDLLASG